MRRAFASSLLSLLLLTTLVWGGCVSCEQFFMLPGVKSCCDTNGHCKTKKPQQSQSTRECKQIAFEHQNSVHLDVALPVIGVHPTDVLPRIVEQFSHPSRVPVVEPSPPDLQVLHSTFLI